MSWSKRIFYASVVLFLSIGMISVFKKKEARKVQSVPLAQVVQAIPEPKAVVEKAKPEPKRVPVEKVKPVVNKKKSSSAQEKPSASDDKILDEVDRVRMLFATNNKKLPIVSTVKYSSHVDWLKGRQAWVTDYATHYKTSRHFIARSLNGKLDYYTQKVANGDRFNVFNPEKEVQFYCVVDLTHCKMRFYYLDQETQERVLLKTYTVGVGREDPESASGYLTPVGKYLLGSKIVVYKPGMMGYFQDQETEMVQVFGTRWLPFEQEMGECSEDPKGYGLHGAPWTYDMESGQLVEKRQCVGKHDSDGCIRLYQQDIEELFSIVVTKPTIVEVVKDIAEITLLGIESKEYPDRETTKSDAYVKS